MRAPTRGNADGDGPLRGALSPDRRGHAGLRPLLLRPAPQQGGLPGEGRGRCGLLLRGPSTGLHLPELWAVRAAGSARLRPAGRRTRADPAPGSARMNAPAIAHTNPD